MKNKKNNVTEISTEDARISVGSSQAWKVAGIAEGTVAQVFPMPYKKDK